MMKRILALVLTMIMVLSLVACGNGEADTEKGTETSGQSETQSTGESTTDGSETDVPANEETKESSTEALPIPEPPFAYVISTEKQDGIEKLVLQADSVTDDVFSNYMKTCFGADSGYSVKSNGVSDDKTEMFFKYENKDLGRIVEFHCGIDENYLVNSCKIVTFEE